MATRTRSTRRLMPYRVRTNDGLTHSAWAVVTGDPNDARTACGINVHHCNLSQCRHMGRHVGRLFSRRAFESEIDCMACITSPDRGLEE